MKPEAYAPVTQEVLDELVGIVGERFVITDAEKLEPYSHDGTRAPRRLSSGPLARRKWPRS